MAMAASARRTTIHSNIIGEGTPLVILHGLPLDHTCVEPSLEPVFKNRRGWKRVYLDLPGHGKSPPEDWIHSNDDMAEAVANFVDSVFPRQPFALAGQSYGAYLARGVTRHLSDRMLGLMLWVSARYPREGRRTPPHTILREDPVATAKLSTDTERWFGSLMVVQGSEGVDAIRNLLVPAAERSNDKFLEPITETKLTADPEETPFLKPTLIVCGRQDSLVGYEDQFELLKMFPRATFAALDYAGHMLGVSEQNDLFRRLVGDWLDRMEASAPSG